MRAPPLDADINAHLLAGTKVEVKLDGSRMWTSECTAVSVNAEKYKMRVSNEGEAVKVELGVLSITAPAVSLQPGPSPKVITGHSRGQRRSCLSMVLKCRREGQGNAQHHQQEEAHGRQGPEWAD